MPRGYKRGSAADNQRIIDKYEAGEDFLAIATELGMKRTTAYGIVRRHQQWQAARDSGQVNEPQTPGRSKLLDQESIDFLVMLVEANPTITVKELNTSLREVFTGKPHVSDSTIVRLLDGELFTV